MSSLARDPPTHRPSIRLLLAALALALLVFGVTHFGDLPNSLHQLRHALGGQELFDFRPAGSSAEVYARLELMGEVGRSRYFAFATTTDVVFPLVTAAFLTLLARHVAAPFGRRSVTLLASIPPAAWLLADLAENLSIAALISNYPAELPAVAGALGVFTLIKRVALASAIAVPAILFLAARLRRVRRHPDRDGGVNGSV